MSSALKARTVGYAGVGLLCLTVMVGGTGIALTRPPANPSPAAAHARTSAPAVAPASAARHRPRHARQAEPVARATPAAAPALAVPHVPPLHHLTPPDAIVTLPRAASPKAVARLRRRSGVRRVAIADRGTIRIHHTRLRTLGVPLSSIRGFTPTLTASSNKLWHSVARGELTVSYARTHHLRHHLGATFVALGPHGRVSHLRVGAFATVGLEGVDALVSHPAAAQLGLAPRRVALVAAPKISLDQLHTDLVKAFGHKAHIDVTRPAPVDQSVVSTYAISRVPASYMDLYRRAAVTCPGLPWTVLAAIGTVETGNGADVHRSSAGAEGPMQFLPSTWAMYGYDADGDGKADIHDPVDAVFSAARYLCAAGAGRGGRMSLDNAIFSYNHAWWYVREVLVIANRYA